MAPESLQPGLSALVSVQDVFHVADGYFEAQENGGRTVRPTTTFIPEVHEGGKIMIGVRRRDQDLSDIETQASHINFATFATDSRELAAYLEDKLKITPVDDSVATIVRVLAGRLTDLSVLSTMVSASHQVGEIGSLEMQFLWKMEALFKDENNESLPNAMALKTFLEA